MKYWNEIIRWHNTSSKNPCTSCNINTEGVWITKFFCVRPVHNMFANKQGGYGFPCNVCYFSFFFVYHMLMKNFLYSILLNGVKDTAQYHLKSVFKHHMQPNSLRATRATVKHHICLWKKSSWLPICLCLVSWQLVINSDLRLLIGGVLTPHIIDHIIK